MISLERDISLDRCAEGMPGEINSLGKNAEAGASKQ